MRCYICGALTGAAPLFFFLFSFGGTWDGATLVSGGGEEGKGKGLLSIDWIS